LGTTVNWVKKRVTIAEFRPGRRRRGTIGLVIGLIAALLMTACGVTRGDDLATYKVDEGCSEFLSGLVAGFEGAVSLVSQNSQGI